MGSKERKKILRSIINLTREGASGGGFTRGNFLSMSLKHKTPEV